MKNKTIICLELSQYTQKFHLFLCILLFLSYSCNSQPTTYTAFGITFEKMLFTGGCLIYEGFGPELSDRVSWYVPKQQELSDYMRWKTPREFTEKMYMTSGFTAPQIYFSGGWNEANQQFSYAYMLFPNSQLIDFDFLKFQTEEECNEWRSYEVNGQTWEIRGFWDSSALIYALQQTCNAGSAAPPGQHCELCPAGTYAEANSVECTDCGPGKYSAAAGATACTDCEPGKYS